MSTIWKLCFSCFACLLAACASWAADLKTLQETYQKSTSQILQSHQPNFDGLQQQYRKSIDTLKAKAQAAGDLQQTLAANAELERFLKEKSMPSQLDDNALPVIKSFQADYVRQFNRLEQEMTAELGTLAKKYEQALDRLQKELTKAGKLNDAVSVQPERDKAQAAIKDYADQLVLLKASATNGAASATSPLPLTKPVDRKERYLVIDLKAGPKAEKYPLFYLAEVPTSGWSDEYKTDKLVLRRVEPGTFMMGFPDTEMRPNSTDRQHEVMLTQAFHIGVFEVTQKQWERVMGDWPSYFNNPRHRDTRPVEMVSYNMICGAGANWPVSDTVDATSFLGLLRARTGKAFALPTEAQWEYACRAGTTTSLNNGKNLTSTDRCPNLAAVGRCKSNGGLPNSQSGDSSSGSAAVGSYPPNLWGLYDMHGNVWEWCLDWRGSYSDSENDPKGKTSGSDRIFRGGSYAGPAQECHSATRSGWAPDRYGKGIGFRIALPAGY